MQLWFLLPSPILPPKLLSRKHILLYHNMGYKLFAFLATARQQSSFTNTRSDAIAHATNSRQNTMDFPIFIARTDHVTAHHALVVCTMQILPHARKPETRRHWKRHSHTHTHDFRPVHIPSNSIPRLCRKSSSDYPVFEWPTTAGIMSQHLMLQRQTPIDICQSVRSFEGQLWS